MADEKELKMEVGDKGKRKAPEPSAGEGLPESGWTAQQVADWLRSSKYASMKDALQGVDGEMLLGLTKEDLERYGKPPAMGAALYNELHPAVDEDARGT